MGIAIGIGQETRQGYTVYCMMHQALVVKRESMASLIHDTSPILRQFFHLLVSFHFFTAFSSDSYRM